MIKTVKLVISENGKDIETVNIETDTDPSHLYKSLEELRKLANATLTKLIEDSDDTADFLDEDTSSENEEDKVCSKPKKRKKKS
ncbi:unnamed protein product [Parnassius apollo]|uniref:(apollo) hypothetical protein n=1 Tax=Parnassius apollo TaxID=110799 RepID=A0A8S3WTD6_PARAO|nr:unnamed protein product [Parnassius apollo]